MGVTDVRIPGCNRLGDRQRGGGQNQTVDEKGEPAEHHDRHIQFPLPMHHDVYPLPSSEAGKAEKRLKVNSATFPVLPARAEPAAFLIEK